MSIYDKIGAKTASVKARAVDKPAEKVPRTAPGMFLDATQRIGAAESRVEELEAKLKQAEAVGGGRELALDQLHEVPGRRRKLKTAEYTELKENLRKNAQAEPIIVRPRAEGGFEIVSGNNRVQIYRELGRPTIFGLVREMDDEQADLSGFYSNLFHPSLPDYEKFRGFKQRQAKTNKNQKELAEEAGIPEQTVSDLFSFDRLAPEARALLDQKPHILGSSAAAKLAQASAAGRGAAVLAAIQRLATDAKFTQAQAVVFANKVPAAPVTKDGPLVIKNGKKVFCKIEARRNKVVLDFTDEALAAGWATKLEAFIRGEMKDGNE